MFDIFLNIKRLGNKNQAINRYVVVEIKKIITHETISITAYQYKVMKCKALIEYRALYTVENNKISSKITYWVIPP